MEKTEYFITYWRVEYPACRQVSAQNVVQVQQAKACFKPEDCPDNRFITSFANFSNIEKKFRKCPKGLAEDCPDYTECKGKRPYTCICSYCRESSLIEDCRCSVGGLTPKEKEFFVCELPNIAGKFPGFAFNLTGNLLNFTSILGGKLPGFTLHSKAEIDSSSIGAKFNHGELCGVYDELIKSSHSKPEYIRFMEKCQRLAKIVREAEPETSLTESVLENNAATNAIIQVPDETKGRCGSLDDTAAVQINSEGMPIETSETTTDNTGEAAQTNTKEITDQSVENKLESRIEHPESETEKRNRRFFEKQQEGLPDKQIGEIVAKELGEEPFAETTVRNGANAHRDKWGIRREPRRRGPKPKRKDS